MIASSQLGRLEALLWPETSETKSVITYALLDSARSDQVPIRLKQHQLESRCLYDPSYGPDIVDVAPYLVALERDGQLTQWVLEKGWGDSWGIFIHSSAGLDELAKHLEQFVVAEMPDKKKVFFRFFDPRVLRVYLPSCNAEELESFFGPIDAFLLEDEEASALMRFERKASEIAIDVASLDD